MRDAGYLFYKMMTLRIPLIYLQFFEMRIWVQARQAGCKLKQNSWGWSMTCDHWCLRKRSKKRQSCDIHPPIWAPESFPTKGASELFSQHAKVSWCFFVVKFMEYKEFDKFPCFAGCHSRSGITSHGCLMLSSVEGKTTEPSRGRTSIISSSSKSGASSLNWKSSTKCWPKFFKSKVSLMPCWWKTLPKFSLKCCSWSLGKDKPCACSFWKTLSAVIWPVPLSSKTLKTMRSSFWSKDPELLWPNSARETRLTSVCISFWGKHLIYTKTAMQKARSQSVNKLKHTPIFACALTRAAPIIKSKCKITKAVSGKVARERLSTKRAAWLDTLARMACASTFSKTLANMMTVTENIATSIHRSEDDGFGTSA